MPMEREEIELPKANILPEKKDNESSNQIKHKDSDRN